MESWKQTKLAPGFTIALWEKLRVNLEPGTYDSNWEIAIAAIEDRFTARFVNPADAIRSLRPQGTSPLAEGRGFAVVALDCLLLEALHGYETGTSSRATGKTFEKVLTTKAHFAKAFALGSRAKSFGWAIRNGLLHDGETRRGWIIRKGTNGGPLVQDLPDNRIVLYRDAFHAAVKASLAEYFTNLREGGGPKGLQIRKAFMKRLNSLCEQSGPPGAV